MDQQVLTRSTIEVPLFNCGPVVDQAQEDTRFEARDVTDHEVFEWECLALVALVDGQIQLIKKVATAQATVSEPAAVQEELARAPRFDSICQLGANVGIRRESTFNDESD